MTDAQILALRVQLRTLLIAWRERDAARARRRINRRALYRALGGLA